VLDTARSCGFDRLLCVIGGAAEEIRATVGFEGVEVVENPEFGEGCSSSIAAALGELDERTDVLVLMLGDQPGVTAGTVAALLAGRGGAPIAVCAYEDGRGHPLAFSPRLFPELRALHGDKAVWKLLDRYADEAAEVPVDGALPPDVDTWEDYRKLRA
jgi:molybdenum cofactor cytidylyltransferase